MYGAVELYYCVFLAAFDIVQDLWAESSPTWCPQGAVATCRLYLSQWTL